MNNTISVAGETILVSSVVIICSKVKKKKTRVRTPSLQSVTDTPLSKRFGGEGWVDGCCNVGGFRRL